MDHLPVGSFSFEYPEVPFLFDQYCPYIYDNGYMPDFPQRLGWDLEDIQLAKSGQATQNPLHTRERAASLIQAWLYFGLIHVITEIPVNTFDYVTENAKGEKILTSRKLPRHIAKWRQRIASKEKEARETHSQDLDDLMKALERFYSVVVGVAKDSFLPYNVTLSMVVLWKTLICAKIQMFPDTATLNESLIVGWKAPFKERLAELGWCTADVSRLTQRFPSPVLCYITSLPPHQSKRDHSACSDSVCKALQVPDSQYKPKHVRPECGCDLATSVGLAVSNIVDGGHIPLLSFSDDLVLSVSTSRQADSKGVLPYVAISHIWADGLGNPNDNTMHYCQLGALQRRVNDIRDSLIAKQVLPTSNRSSPMPWWIDTICVPATEGPSKSAAIKAMEHVYRGAFAVLVIDPQLEKVEEAASPLHKAIAIATSSWWTRLWTLQEGLFAKRLLFQLKSMAISLSDLTDHPTNYLEADRIEDEGDISQMMINDVLSSQNQIPSAELRSDGGRLLLRNTQWRSTSRASDECVCLCILLGLDVSEIEKCPPDPIARMKRFIQLQKAFPSECMFLNVEHDPLCDEDGFRWAPKTFLGQKTGGTLSYGLRDPFHDAAGRTPVKPDTSYADASGLHVKYPGLVLSLCNGAKHTTNIVGRIALRFLDETADGVWYIILLPQSRSWTSCEELQGLYVILANQPTKTTDRGSQGILVSSAYEPTRQQHPTSNNSKVTTTVDLKNRIFCRYQANAVVTFSKGVPDTQRVHFSTNLARASSLSEDQNWCVG